MTVGTEWLIEAAQCDAEKLRDETVLRNIFDRVIAELGLKVVSALWHKFPREGGVTGMAMLTESHLTCHTYPEYGTATFNLYCCRTRPEWNWERQLRSRLEAKEVFIRTIRRGSVSEHESEFEISNFRSNSVGGPI